MLVAWAVAAFAQDRDPLPALPVERPVVLPRGWALLDAELVRGGITSSARYAAMRRAELRVAVPVAFDAGVRDPELGARFRLHRSEPPNRSLALDLSVTTPTGEGVPVAALGLVGGEQLGPLLATLAVAGRTDRSAVAEPRVLLQIGPLFPFAEAEVRLDAGGLDASGAGGLGVQLNRALAVRGRLGADGGAVGLEVAL